MEVVQMEIVLGTDLVDVVVMVEEEEEEDEMVAVDQQAQIITQHGMDQVVGVVEEVEAEEMVGVEEMVEVEETAEVEELGVSEELEVLADQALMEIVLGMGLEAVMVMEGEEVEAMGAVEEEGGEVVKAGLERCLHI